MIGPITEYFRIKTADGKIRWGTCFSRKGKRFSFLECKVDGDIHFGRIGYQKNKAVIGLGDDLIWIKPALMNNFFGELELVK